MRLLDSLFLKKFGYKSGHITTLYLHNGKFDRNNVIDNRPHSNEVTGFSFSEEILMNNKGNPLPLADR